MTYCYFVAELFILEREREYKFLFACHYSTVPLSYNFTSYSVHTD